MGDARSCSTFSALASTNLRASAAMPGHILTGAGHMSIVPKAGHGRRMPPAVLLVINLRIGATADCCCGSSSSLLLPDSVKPAVQRGVQNSRGLVPPEAERVQTR